MTRLANSKHCFVCGVENKDGLHLVLDCDRPGHVYGRINIPQKFEGWPGIVHGGILASLLDEAGGRCADCNVIPKIMMVTGSLQIRYRKPAPVGEDLLLEGQFINKNGRVIKAHSQILNSNNDILAEADILYVEIDKANTDNQNLDMEQWVVLNDGEEHNDYRISSTQSN